ncbi:hypothetical protein C1701_18530 [Actinoalloteichus sp. AHMU CJ021]|uniref:hypothetical protein n=1 Tax=Actinoalloteichus sp. AHMU CJ021 TaxID=2072503 RepID=UPI000CA040C1|nr:hypothetical protein C1701_18530 [Actinoalloteichus sp. AHMU CJ021]
MDIDHEVRESVCDLAEIDYLSMTAIIGILVDVGGVPWDQQISRAGRIAAGLVREGRITPGSLKGGTFTPWEGSRDEQAARIERETREYEEEGREVLFGDIAWFA